MEAKEDTPESMDIPKNQYINRKELENLVNTTLAGKLTENFKLHISDNKYYLPSLEDSHRLLEESKVGEYQWHDEVFDCDDFAIMLKAHFCKDAYKHYERGHSHCLGIAWGQIPRPHALNWVINNDRKLRFIDPMYGEIYLPQERARFIWMMMI